MPTDPAASRPANAAPAATPDPAAPQHKVNTKAAGIVGVAVMCSRVLGLIREVVFAALFGAGREMDAFTTAFKTPNLLRDLFAEGALSTAFVTTFSKKIAKEGEQSAWQLANKVATLTAIFMSALVCIGILIAPVLIPIITPGFTAEPGKAELTIQLAQIMYPFILLVSLGALVMGMLNSRNVFGVPALASSFFNIGSIIGGVTLGWLFDPGFGEKALFGLALGTLIGGALQMAVQLPSLHKVGFRFRPDFHWRDEGVRTILRMMGPAIIAASSVQVNVMVNMWFASFQSGAVFTLNAAFRLMQLPLGIFGVAIGTVTLPLLSRIAASGSRDEFGHVLGRGMRLGFLLTVPATIGLILLARPIISLIYEHGKFDAVATDQAALALQGYALGLCAYSALKVLTPAFYAIDRRRTPMIVSFVSIGLNFSVNWYFFFELGWGVFGLALGTGTVALANFLILYLLMRRETNSLATRELAVTFAKLILPAGLLAFICWGAREWLFGGWAQMAIWNQAALLLTTIAVAAGAFFGSAMLMRIEELEDLKAVVRRRLNRRRTPAA